MIDSALLYVLYVLGALVCLRTWKQPRHGLYGIPSIGYSAPLLSYITALKFFIRGREMIQQGYDLHKGRAFKIPGITSWQVIVTGPKLVDELCKAGDNELSLSESAADIMQMDYTFGPTIRTNGYHLPLIQNFFSREFSKVYVEMQDELVSAFEELIPVRNDWVHIPALETVTKIVCRTSNRMFVGLPLCRDPDYNELCIHFTPDVAKTAVALGLFPSFLRPLASRFLNFTLSKTARAEKHLGHIIEKRLKMKEELGPDYEGRPNDMLSWIINEAIGEEKQVPALVRRVLSLDFAAIHTTSMTFVHALYEVAAHPEYVHLLREEVEQVLQVDGWTKQAIQNMRKLDSFMKESMRVNGLGIIVITRKALKDFTFSDDTFIPKDTFVSAATMPAHYDDEYYENASVFDPWRFSDKPTSTSLNGEGAKHHMVSTSKEFMAFGHGKHACPGRFFASAEMKAMMAHILVNYDITLEKEGEIPPPFWVYISLVPNTSANVLFRRRQM